MHVKTHKFGNKLFIHTHTHQQADQNRQLDAEVYTQTNNKGTNNEMTWLALLSSTVMRRGRGKHVCSDRDKTDPLHSHTDVFAHAPE